MIVIRPHSGPYGIFSLCRRLSTPYVLRLMRVDVPLRSLLFAEGALIRAVLPPRPCARRAFLFHTGYGGASTDPVHRGRQDNSSDGHPRRNGSMAISLGRNRGPSRSHACDLDTSSPRHGLLS